MNDFPKITFPKKDGYKKKYLFVDFETTEQPEVGKAIAREFINDFNSKFRQLGHVLAECAKVSTDRNSARISYKSKNALTEIFLIFSCKEQNKMLHKNNMFSSLLMVAQESHQL